MAASINEDGGTAIFVRCDVSSAESAEALVQRTVAELGGIDHLVNNAAIYGAMEFNLLISVDWAYYKEVHGREPRRCARDDPRGLPRDREAGGARSSTSPARRRTSTPGFWLVSPRPASTASPSSSPTSSAANGSASTRSRRDRPTPRPPARRRATPPKDIVRNSPGHQADGLGRRHGRRLLFLLSDDASWVTGQILAVDGGRPSVSEGRRWGWDSSASATSASRWRSGSPPRSTSTSRVYDVAPDPLAEAGRRGAKAVGSVREIDAEVVCVMVRDDDQVRAVAGDLPAGGVLVVHSTVAPATPAELATAPPGARRPGQRRPDGRRRRQPGDHGGRRRDAFAVARPALEAMGSKVVTPDRSVRARG